MFNADADAAALLLVSEGNSSAFTSAGTIVTGSGSVTSHSKASFTFVDGGNGVQDFEGTVFLRGAVNGDAEAANSESYTYWQYDSELKAEFIVNGNTKFTFVAYGYGSNDANGDPYYAWQFGEAGSLTQINSRGIGATLDFTIDDLENGDVLTIELTSYRVQVSRTEVLNDFGNASMRFADFLGVVGRLGAYSPGPDPFVGTWVVPYGDDPDYVNKTLDNINSYIDGIEGLPGGDTSSVDYWMDALAGRLDGSTIIVTAEGDDWNLDTDFDDVTLREAIAMANASSFVGTPKIKFAPWVEDVILDGSELEIDENLEIAGPGADKLTIDANGLSRVFSIDAGVDAAISGLTITGGSVTASSPGGNVGGGVFNQGDLSLVSVVVAGNHTDYTNLSGANTGGGVYSTGGDLQIIDSTIDGNRSRYGGGVSVHVNAGKLLEISGSTLSNNLALSSSDEGAGGGIYLQGASTAALQIDNSTLSGNRASGGAAIYVGTATTTLSIVNATIADNHTKNAAGSYISGGLAAGINNFFAGAVTLHNTILADNVASNPAWHNGMGSLAGAGSSHNLIDIGYSGIGITHSPTTTGNKVGSGTRLATLLAPLGDYGGKTKTHALKVGSPALDAGKGSLTDMLDQRGYAREVNDLAVSDGIDGNRDIGAYEAGVGTTLIVRSDGDRNDSISLKATTDSLRLREALALSAALAGSEVISFDQSGWADNEIQLSSTWGQLSVGSGVEVAGPGADLLTIAAAPSSRAINISNGAGVTLSGMRITGGAASGNGGGVYISSSSPTLDRVQLDGNSAGYGGGIYVAAYAGLTLKNSTLWDNTATGGGGGLAAASYSNVSVLNSTVSDNSATSIGGGIYAISGANLRIVNSTIAYNLAGYGGGGGVAAASSSTVRLDNTIVAHNSVSLGGRDISGTFSSSSRNNLIGFDATTGNGIDDGEDSNQVGGEGSDPALNAKLRALAAVNGLLVHSLMDDSPAIDKGEDDLADDFDLAFDQIGYDRIIDYDGLGSDNIDIGAYELALADV